MIWNCRDKKAQYGEKILLMGIVNITPDSFSDGGSYINADFAVNKALALVGDGADIIDLGAQSTRPGYEEISPEEEWSRLEPVLTSLRKKTDVIISVDTYFPLVARRAVEKGADVINDISGSIHPEMAQIVANSGCGWVITHNGSGGIDEVADFFKKSAEKCSEYGISPSQLCFDMGIGFGKSYEQNMQLIANVSALRADGFPLLLGVSRKSVIGIASQQQNPQERIFGNIAADTSAIFGGVDIIRLHDIKNEKQGILTAQEIRKWIR